MDYELAANYWIKKDAEAARMNDAALEERIEQFIKAHNTCALATACDGFVRCTPIEYNYVDGSFYLFSEGGLKFKALKENKHVAFAVYEPYGGFGQLKSLQVSGTTTIIEPFSEEYLQLLAHKKIPVEAMKKLPQPMHLIKIAPESYDYLDSDLKKENLSVRQHLTKACQGHGGQQSDNVF